MSTIEESGTRMQVPSSTKPHLIILAGPAGSGKSTVQAAFTAALRKKQQKIAVVDPDDWFAPMERHLLKTLGHDPEDRDSLAFKQHCRPYRYAGLWNGIELLLNQGSSVLCVAPFTSEIKTGALWDIHETRLSEHPMQVFWLTAKDEIRFERIQKRQRSEDQYKLEHWDEYLERSAVGELDSRAFRLENNSPEDVAFVVQCLQGFCPI